MGFSFLSTEGFQTTTVGKAEEPLSTGLLNSKLTVHTEGKAGYNNPEAHHQSHMSVVQVLLPEAYAAPKLCHQLG